MKRRRIVLVEDDESIRTIAQLSLEHVGGFHVTAFASGPDAVAGAAAAAPQLLVLDVNMPGMDGVQTLAALRGQPPLANVPAVFLTVGTDAARVSRLRALGAADVIAKPFDPRHLCERVASLLSAPGPAEPAHRGPVALLVEDEPGIRYLLDFMLRQEGWTVLEAVDGLAAQRAIEAGPPPGLVLMDIVLPGIDGLRLLEFLRGREGWGDVPVMMLTSRGDELSIQRALAAGANDYLGKPFQPDELRERLRRLVRVPPR